MGGVNSDILHSCLAYLIHVHSALASAHHLQILLGGSESWRISDIDASKSHSQLVPLTANLMLISLCPKER